MKYSDVNGMKLDFSTMVEIRKGLSILDPSTLVGMTMLIGNDTPFRHGIVFESQSESDQSGLKSSVKKRW